MRIHEAANHRNFQGTFVVSGGGSVSSARIAHFCDGRNQFERIESLDGPARQVFRHNDVVHTLWPASRVALLEQRDLLSTFPALLQAGDDHIQDVYEVQIQASERIAGREADVLWVRPRDAHRYGFRLWADKASGLLLRSDVLGERMEILETAAFSDVAIGIRPQFESRLAANAAARWLSSGSAGADAYPAGCRRLGSASDRPQDSGRSVVCAGLSTARLWRP